MQTTQINIPHTQPEWESQVHGTPGKYHVTLSPWWLRNVKNQAHRKTPGTRQRVFKLPRFALNQGTFPVPPCGLTAGSTMTTETLKNVTESLPALGRVSVATARRRALACAFDFCFFKNHGYYIESLNLCCWVLPSGGRGGASAHVHSRTELPQGFLFPPHGISATFLLSHSTQTHLGQGCDLTRLSTVRTPSEKRPVLWLEMVTKEIGKHFELSYNESPAYQYFGMQKNNLKKEKMYPKMWFFEKIAKLLPGWLGGKKGR